MAAHQLLNNVDHGALRIAIGHGARFGDAVNQARVFPTEFEELQREYAVVLRRDGSDFHAMALLGLDRDENLFLDGDRWDARYIPAVHARGPFAVGTAGASGEPMIHLDPTHPRVGAEGAPIFREHGGNAPLLDHIIEVLDRIYVGMEIERAMYAAFAAAGLVTPLTLQLDLDDARRYNVPDCFSIDGASLAALDGTTLATLHRNDFLRHAIWLATSLGNVRHLIDRKLRRDG